MKDPDVQRQFARSAKGYAASRVHERGESLRVLIEHSAPRRTDLVLDIATGTAHTAIAFAPLVDRVIATDITLEMIREGRRLSTEKERANIIFQLAAAEALPFRDGAFDIVACRIAAHHFGDVGRAVQEMARVIGPKGRIALVDLVGSNDPLEDTFINRLESLHDMTHVKSYSASEWRRLFGQAGLRIEMMIDEMIELPGGISLNEWTKRSETPQENVHALQRLLLTADEKKRRRFNIRAVGDDIRFNNFHCVIVARKRH